MPEMTTAQIMALCAAGFIYGVTKTGILGLTVLVIPFLLHLFTPTQAIGLALPMLALADLLAVFLFRKTVKWRVLLAAVPGTALGMLAGWWILARAIELPDGSGEVLLRRLIAGFMLLVLAAGIVFRIHKNRIAVIVAGDGARGRLLSRRTALLGGICVIGGFSTAISNFSGPAWVVYLMSFRLEKRFFLGTAAWIIFVVNLVKIPVTVQLGLINADSLAANAFMIPFLLLGAACGKLIVKRISQEFFDNLVQIVALIGVVHLLLTS